MQAASLSLAPCRVVDLRITLKVVARGKPTISMHRQAAVLGARGRVHKTPPGSESGACMQRGNSGTWESHLSPCSTTGRGDRSIPGPGVAWGLPPRHEPLWKPRMQEAGQVAERRATSAGIREGQDGSLSGA
jgi:hypothetical protein